MQFIIQLVLGEDLQHLSWLRQVRLYSKLGMNFAVEITVHYRVFHERLVVEERQPVQSRLPRLHLRLGDESPDIITRLAHLLRRRHLVGHAHRPRGCLGPHALVRQIHIVLHVLQSLICVHKVCSNLLCSLYGAPLPRDLLYI